MSIIPLNRINITGPIDNETPICVLIEIAASMGWVLEIQKIDSNSYINKIIEKIQNTKINSIHGRDLYSPNLKFCQSELELIVRYLNPRYAWPYRLAIEAFRHLVEFEREIKVPPADSFFGPKSPENPLAYDVMMLYRICRHHRIPMNRYTSFESMVKAVKYLSCPACDLKQKLLDVVENLDSSGLISLLLASESCPEKGESPTESPSQIRRTTKNIEPDSIPSSELQSVLKSISSYEHLLMKAIPQSHSEAIVLAAIVYGLNIIESSNPIKEYSQILNKRYAPYDEKFRKRYQRNPLLYNLKKTFTLRIPGVYTTDSYRQFAFNEGYLESDLRDSSAEQLLYLSRTTPTFHLGWHPDSTNENDQTPIELEDLNSIPSSLLITYGIFEGGPLKTFKISELTACFRNGRSFVNPLNPRENFTEIAMRKLKILASEFTGSSEATRESSIRQATNQVWDLIAPLQNVLSNIISSGQGEKKIVRKRTPIPDEVKEAYRALLNAINYVEGIQRANSQQAKDLATRYENGELSERFEIRQFFNYLLELGMYMRGWKAINPEETTYPIDSISTNFNYRYQSIVDLNVTQALSRFEQHVDSLNDKLSKKLKNLPLIRIQQRGNNFIFEASSDYAQGLTLWERIKIIKDHDNPYSCIRLSSNWLTASAYYYMTAIGLEPPFDYTKLGYIQ